MLLRAFITSLQSKIIYESAILDSAKAPLAALAGSLQPAASQLYHFRLTALPAILRSQLEQRLSTALQRQVSLAQVRCNPFTLTCTLVDLQVSKRQGSGTFLAFEALEVNVELSSLARMALVCKSITLQGPRVAISLNKEKGWNFSDLLTGQPGSDSRSAVGQDKPFLFSLHNITIRAGSLTFQDQLADMHHEVEAINLSLPRLSNFPSEVEIYTQPSFRAVVNGTPLMLDGDSKPLHRSRQSQLELRFTNIDLTSYLAYLPTDFGFQVNSALLDLDLGCTLMQHPDGQPAVNLHGTVALHQVEIHEKAGEHLLSFPRLTLELERGHLLRREFHLARLHWQQPQLSIRRLADGTLNLATLLPPAQEKQSPASPPPLFTLAEAHLDAARLDYIDLSTDTPFVSRLQPITLQLANFSTETEQQADFKLDLQSESAEQLQIAGNVTMTPLALEGKVHLRGLQLAKYQPYLANHLQVGLQADHLELHSGFSLNPAANLFQLHQTELQISQLTLAPERPEETIHLATLQVEGGEVDIHQRHLQLARVFGQGGSLPLIRRASGTLNLSQFFHSRPQPQAVEVTSKPLPTGQEAPWRFRLKQLELDTLHFTLTDLLPSQTARLQLDELQLQATNISNWPEERGQAQLHCRFNEQGAIDLQGSLGLEPVNVDLQLNLTRLPWRALQPYLAEQLQMSIK